jgi:hypothetical protein
MSNARSLSAYARTLALKARATKRSVRLIALFVVAALASAAAASVPSSAKLIDHLINVGPARATHAAAAPAALPAPAAEKAAIRADKNVYAPGETVTFTGINWTPGETVTITLSANTPAAESVTLHATADENGSFVAKTTMPGDVDGDAADGNAGAGQSANPRAGDIIYTAVATGASSGASARARFKEGERAEKEGDDDADLPAFLIGKINKEDYLSRRTEHTNRLRGIERGRPFDPGARGRAIGRMERREGHSAKKAAASSDAASFDAAATSGAQGTGSGVGAASVVNALSAGSPAWTPIGPAPLSNGQTFGVTQPVSGRVSAIAIHPTNPDIAYVGTAQGGVYRTLDGGQSWTAIFDNAQTLAVGSIAIAPSQPSTIYVGTGEGNFSCDTFFGVGLYRIDNADGASPQLSGPFNKDGASADVLTGRSVSKVLVHPTNPDIIFIAANSGGIGGYGCDAGLATASRGLYRSTNATSASATFQKITTNTANTGNRSVTDMEFEPGNPNTMLATVVGFSTAGDGGVYRSTNALAATPSFTRTLSAGSTTATARVELAVNKVGGVVTAYAATSEANGTVKRSTDGGVTWSAALANATGFCGTQCTYDMPIAVDPTNAGVIYIGGNADGAATAIIKKSTNATAATPTFTKVQTGLHADSHAIEVDPSNSNTVWFGSDGGVWKSANAAATWTSLNNTGFNATQFQSIALHPTDPNYTIGGTQDNGTERMRPDGTWTRTDFGDGGYALIDQGATNTTTVRQYHTYFNQVGTGGLVGFATTTSSTAFENWGFFGCGGTANGLSCTDSAVSFYAPIALGPGSPNTLYFGTDRLYRSINSGVAMTVVSQQFVSGVAITAIGVSRQNDNVRLVGLGNGKVFRTATGSSTLTDVTGAIPARYIARAVIDPNNQDTAYVTLSNYFGASTAHVYKTTNLSGATPTWAGIDGGQIPDVPVNAFAVDPADSNTLYAGTDIGVYRSADGGATWAPFSNGLPRVAVFDMAIQAASRTLRIATHGRGMWELSIAATPAVLQGTVTDAVTHVGLANATVTAGSNSAITDENGFYQFPSIPAATYGMTVSAIGYNTAAASNVATANGSVTTRDFALNAAPSAACPVDTSQTDFLTGSASNVDVTTSPGDVTLALPGAITVEQTTIQIFSNNITPTVWQAQTFVPTATGKLTQMDFQAALSSAASVTGTLVVEIRNTVGGSPGPTVLATANLTTISGTGNTFYTVTFASPPSVVSGTQYALVLRTGTGGPYRAVASLTNVYPNGSWQQSSNSGATWGNVVSGTNTLDLVFRAYVVPQVYATDGNYVSLPKDANQADGTMAGWSTISWNATTPAGTTVRFQAAAGNNAGGLFTFVGPDGTPNSFFTSGASLAQFNGFRYLKYKAFLSTTNTAVTPTLSDVTICNSNTPLPATILNVAPATGPYGGTTTLAATLTSGGSPLAGKPVVFKLNGVNFPGNTATTGVDGVATIPNVSLAGLNAGTYVNYITAKFAPDSSYAGTSGSNSLTVDKATPTISWNNPSAITYGTPLGASQLNATASVPGAFAYTPAAGTVLGAGDNQTLHVEFTPTDAVNYANASKDVTINVQKATATITLTGLVHDYSGAPQSATATTTPAGLSGLVVKYNGSTTPPTGAGSYAVVASLTNDNYQADDATATLIINKVAPTVAATGNTCTYSGSPCEATGSATGVDGADLGAVTLTYTPGGSSAPVNAGDYTVVASIGETANHTAGSSGPAAIKVNKATPTINWANPSALIYGTPLGGAQLNATATRGAGGPSVDGGFAYGPAAGTVLNVGNAQTLHADFTPADAANYTSASKDVSINVVQATLTIKTADAAKVYGSPNPAFTAGFSGFVNGDGPGSLGGALTFVTSATQGSAAGAYAVTPGGLTSANYAISFLDGTLSVMKATLTITADNKARIYNAPDPPFTAGYSGFVNGDNAASAFLGAPALSTTAQLNSNTGAYPINVAAGTLVSANYEFAFVAGTLTINRAPSATVTDGKMLATSGAGVLTASLLDINSLPIAGRTITLILGAGVGAQACSATTDATGRATCQINPVVQPLGPGAVSGSFAGDGNYLPSSGVAATLIFAYPAGAAGGTFVIGDLNAAVGTQVTFWGSQWTKLNSLSGGAAPSSFKGFANQTGNNSVVCGGAWSANPGNSSGVRDTLPSYMAVIVTGSVGKSGSDISGIASKIVIVKTNAGYESSPGHAGTGTVVAVLCQ